MSGSVRVVLKEVRCVFPKLFQAEEFQGKTRYSVGLLLPEGSENLKKVQAAIKAAIAAQYGEAEVATKIKEFRGSKQSWPLRPADDGYMITPKRDVTKGQPLVLAQGSRTKELTIDTGLPYAGCWLNVSFDVFCYTKMGGGVTSYLNGVQLHHEDAPLAGGATASSCRDDFDELADTGDADNDLEDIPF